MSIHVQIHPEATPTIEYGQLVLDESVHLALPLDGTKAAEWCEAVSKLLATYATFSRRAAEMSARDLEAARQDVLDAKAERLRESSA